MKTLIFVIYALFIGAIVVVAVALFSGCSNEQCENQLRDCVNHNSHLESWLAVQYRYKAECNEADSINIFTKGDGGPWRYEFTIDMYSCQTMTDVYY